MHISVPGPLSCDDLYIFALYMCALYVCIIYLLVCICVHYQSVRRCSKDVQRFLDKMAQGLTSINIQTNVLRLHVLLCVCVCAVAHRSQTYNVFWVKWRWVWASTSKHAC
jgi:hypothetical protein